MKYNFDEIIDRRNSSSMKWNGGTMLKNMGVMENYNEDTLPIFVADMDFKCAQPIIDALGAVVEHGIFGYSATADKPEYNRAIRRWFRDRHGWDFPEEAITFVNGTVEAISLAVEAYSEKGDGVLITRPVYGPFSSAVEKCGRVVVNSELLNQDGYYTMDFEDIEQKAKDPSVKIFLLCSPHNPTGRVWTKEELVRLSDICTRNNMILVSDEVHCDITRKGVTFISAGLAGNPDTTVVLNAINKSFNCAGLSCSHAVISNKELRDKYQEAVGFRLPSPFAIAALIAAYTKGDEWLDQVNEYIDGTYDWVLDFMAKEMPKVKVRRPEGTYVLWMDFRETGLSPDEVHNRIYNMANVGLEPGAMFGKAEGTGFERVCLPSPRSIIKQAFERMAEQFKDCK